MLLEKCGWRATFSSDPVRSGIRAPRMPKSAASARRYWLFKSEPSSFSFDDLLRSKGQRTAWDGVRNHQARNFLRDEVQVGDGVLFYHSSADPLAIAGVCRVVKAGYPDASAFDPTDDHYDPKSDPDKPTWYVVDVEAVTAFDPPLLRTRLQGEPALADLMLLRRGSRLSVQPVTAAEWRTILKLGGLREDVA
jgi:predicted RNA-binding protein with PUA-like domain